MNFWPHTGLFRTDSVLCIHTQMMQKTLSGWRQWRSFIYYVFWNRLPSPWRWVAADFHKDLFLAWLDHFPPTASLSWMFKHELLTIWQSRRWCFLRFEIQKRKTFILDFIQNKIVWQKFMNNLNGFLYFQGSVWEFLVATKLDPNHRSLLFYYRRKNLFF